MTHDEMRELLKRRPFQPFRIFMDTGETHEVTRPDWTLEQVTGVEFLNTATP